MIPRKGKIKKHHFAHKAGPEQCNPDDALHETAKAAICQGFLRALRKGLRYPIRIPCDRCEEPIETNVAIEGAGMSTERNEVRGTRPDFFDGYQQSMGSRMTLWMAEGGTVLNCQVSAIYPPSWSNLPPPITPHSGLNQSEQLRRALDLEISRDPVVLLVRSYCLSYSTARPPTEKFAIQSS